MKLLLSFLLVISFTSFSKEVSYDEIIKMCTIEKNGIQGLNKDCTWTYSFIDTYTSTDRNWGGTYTEKCIHENMSPVAYATYLNDLELLDKLINKGFNVNIKERVIDVNHNSFSIGGRPKKPPYQCSLNVEESSFSYALKNKNLEALELLIPAGLDLELEHNNKEKPAHMALINEEFLRLLLEAGVNVNSVDKDGKTILFKAARSETKGLLILKFDPIVNLEILNLALNTYSFNKDRQAYLKTIIDLIDADTSKLDIENFKYVESVKHLNFLISLGIDFSARDKEGKVPLMYFAGKKIEMLNEALKLANDTDFLARDIKGSSVLDYIVTNHNWRSKIHDRVKSYIKHIHSNNISIDVFNDVDYQGRTPLFNFIKGNSRRRARSEIQEDNETVELLILAGSKIKYEIDSHIKVNMLKYFREDIPKSTFRVLKKYR
jgi:ankyrin repeat protein